MIETEPVTEGYPPHPISEIGGFTVPYFDTEDWKWRWVTAHFVFPWAASRVVTWTIFWVTLSLYLISRSSGTHPFYGINYTLFDWGVLRYYVLDQGQVWRLATALLLHVNFAHWFENAVFLYFLGRVLEPTFGSVRFLALFFLAGLVSTTLTTTEVFSLVVGVGMSGSIYALIGAQIAHLQNNRATIANYDRRIRRNLAGVGVLVTINGCAAISGTAQVQMIGLSVDVLAHVGGFIAGYILTRWCGPRLRFAPAPTLNGARAVVNVMDDRPFTWQLFLRMVSAVMMFVAVVLLIERS